ncbi:layilin-like isoform X2 [Arapaima gigas]
MEPLKLMAALFAVSLGSCCAARLLTGERICRRGTELPCYRISYFDDPAHRLTFDEARNACQSDSGELLSVETESEQHLVERFVQQLQATPGSFWIGFRRSHGYQETLSNCSGQYRWLDGSLATFRKWHAGEPSCGSQVCVAIGRQFLRSTGRLDTLAWNDDDCGTRNNFICKYSQDAPTMSAPPVDPPVTWSDDENKVVQSESAATHLNVAYIIFPIITILLLLLLASGVFCFRVLSRGRKELPSQISEGNESTLTQDAYRCLSKQHGANLSTCGPYSGDYENLPKTDMDSGFVTNVIYETCQGQGRSCRDAGWVENEIYG